MQLARTRLFSGSKQASLVRIRQWWKRWHVESCCIAPGDVDLMQDCLLCCLVCIGDKRTHRLHVTNSHDVIYDLSRQTWLRSCHTFSFSIPNLFIGPSCQWCRWSNPHDLKGHPCALNLSKNKSKTGGDSSFNPAHHVTSSPRCHSGMLAICLFLQLISTCALRRLLHACLEQFLLVLPVSDRFG